MENVNNIEVGNRLTELRKNKGLTQEQVAKEISMNRTSLTRYENGERVPKANELISLSKLYNTTIDYILTGVSAENKSTHDSIGFSQNAIEVLKKWNIRIKQERKKEYPIQAYEKAIKFLEKIFDTENVLENNCCNHMGLNLLAQMYDFIENDFIEEAELLSKTLNAKETFVIGFDGIEAPNEYHIVTCGTIADMYIHRIVSCLEAIREYYETK